MKTDINEGFGFVIHDVARLLRWSFDRQSQDLGLTRAQWSVLAHLFRGDGIQQKSLACLMDIAPITLARHLDHLEVDAWIERRDDPNDRRAKRVYLTPKAKPMIEKLGKLGQKIRIQALSGIDAKDEKMFLDVLLRIRENLGDNN
ncbi:MAG: MarR family transcriptional regulator [Pseudohongiella sp.]|nr:MarR family transcriptional regulator [Pseudohongiella sp.]